LFLKGWVTPVLAQLINAGYTSPVPVTQHVERSCPARGLPSASDSVRLTRATRLGRTKDLRATQAQPWQRHWKAPRERGSREYNMALGDVDVLLLFSVNWQTVSPSCS
jgi:hypothetical protein